MKQKLQLECVKCKAAKLRNRARNYLTVDSKWAMSDARKTERIESDPVGKALLASAHEERHSYWRVCGGSMADGNDYSPTSFLLKPRMFPSMFHFVLFKSFY